MSIVEVERYAVVLPPRLHQTIVGHVRVSIEGDKGLISIWHRILSSDANVLALSRGAHASVVAPMTPDAPSIAANTACD